MISREDLPKIRVFFLEGKMLLNFTVRGWIIMHFEWKRTFWKYFPLIFKDFFKDFLVILKNFLWFFSLKFKWIFYIEFMDALSEWFSIECKGFSMFICTHSCRGSISLQQANTKFPNKTHVIRKPLECEDEMFLAGESGASQCEIFF